jgi:hypothetical protein
MSLTGGPGAVARSRQMLYPFLKCRPSVDDKPPASEPPIEEPEINIRHNDEPSHGGNLSVVLRSASRARIKASAGRSRSLPF